MPVVETTPPVLARPKLASRDRSAPVAARLRVRGALHRIHKHPLHRRQVDHEAAVADCVAGYIMPAAAHRYQQVVGAGKVNRRNHIRRPTQRAISAGRRSIMPFQTLRASS